ncbi:MAG: transcription-repair coupling factor [Zetaproteobacteria bacterium]|nr:transcription-repair coupling factor [Zetaproteobacteria bacterium]
MSKPPVDVCGLHELASRLSVREDTYCPYFGPHDQSLLLWTFVESLRLHQHSVGLVLVQNRKEVLDWAQSLQRLQQNPGGESVRVVTFPHHSFWGRRVPNPPRHEEIARLSAMGHLSQLQTGETLLVVSTLAGLCQQTLTPEFVRDSLFTLKCQDVCDPEQFVQRLQCLGYQCAPNVHDPGVYAVRGGIVEVFPVHLHKPVRIEFFADAVFSIHQVELSSEFSGKELSEVVISRALEVATADVAWRQGTQAVHEALNQQSIHAGERHAMLDSLRQKRPCAHFAMFAPMFREQQASFVEHLPGAVPTFCTQTQTKLWEQFQHHMQDCQLGYEDDLAMGHPSYDPAFHFRVPPSVQHILQRHIVACAEVAADERERFVCLHLKGVEGSLPPRLDPDNPVACLAEIRARLDQGLMCMIVVQSQADLAPLTAVLLQHHLPKPQPYCFAPGSRTFVPGAQSLQVVVGLLESPFVDESTGVWWLPADRVLAMPSARKVRKKAKKKLQDTLDSLHDLQHGDALVHVEHGIGIYRGMVTLELGHGQSDFIKIEYQNKDYVYVPVAEVGQLYRYFANPAVGAQGEASAPPRLDKLRSSGWKARRRKTHQAVKDIAQDLLKILAEQKLAKGKVYGAPPPEYVQFCEDFPYQETEDQLTALEDIEQDLCASKPMDRLIIGDVGFGKTEVALRVAYRAVLEGYQVLLLVPTTVLCLQHTTTLHKRLYPCGVNVQGVSSRNSVKQQKEILAALEAGKLDILVGTHRLLSADIRPHHLGLLIVDEEHKFGVMHKEKIKKLRMGCDVLTLSATPIPRTLHMSMIGLRDISVLTTPPMGRRPVFTQLCQNDDEIITRALQYELQREGQAFVMYNRVEDIYSVAERVRGLVPGAAVAVAHGQMSKAEMEKIIVDFMHHRYAVLVATTIIESGLDIPSVNTLIVLHAERYGLAQLHQIRGRVGRSSVQAYCYFVTAMAPSSSEAAMQRLQVLVNHQELGAGFHISSRDLEMRGAGDLIGGKQAGHMESVGIDLYTRMLDEAIAQLSAEDWVPPLQPEIKVKWGDCLEASYIPEELERLRTYKRLVAAADHQDVYNVQNWMRDKFGALPQTVQQLIAWTHIRVSLARLGIQALSGGEKGFFTLEVSPQHAQCAQNLVQYAQQHPQQCSRFGEHSYALKGSLQHEGLQALSYVLREIEADVSASEVPMLTQQE